MLKVLCALFSAAVLSTMPGCVVWEIRDQMVNTNAQLTDIKSELTRTNELLADVKTNLATTNEIMAGVEKRIEVLDPIAKSLASLETSLKTVQGLIEKIPFVGSSDKESDKPAADAPGSSAAPTPAAKPNRP